jgi:hypothetical protein
MYPPGPNLGTGTDGTTGIRPPLVVMRTRFAERLISCATR